MSTEQLCNRNELINADFRQGRLVNQRGQTTFTEWDPMMDMWRKYTAEGTIILEDDCLVLTPTEQSTVMCYQPIEGGLAKFNGKLVTISALLKDGTLLSASGIIDIQSDWQGVSFSANYQGLGITLQQMDSILNPNALSFRVHVEAGYPAKKISAVMLEYGDISTLENWHGDYAIELLKCQRYLYALPRLSTFFVETSNTGKQARIVVTTPVDMRVAPSIENLDLTKWGLRIDGVVYSLDNLSVERKAGNETILLCNGVFPSNQAGSCYLLDAVFLSKGSQAHWLSILN